MIFSYLSALLLGLLVGIVVGQTVDIKRRVK
ncbi:MAG: hypothetical protein PWP62_1335 [Eubacteriaceae bacterium]|nr:hypothetical protein [Eubacteriaceae bacterium]